MRALLVVLVAIFVVISSVNMVPAPTFLEEIKKISKRQGGNADHEFCVALGVRCYEINTYCIENAILNEYDLYHKCTCKTKWVFKYFFSKNTLLFSSVILTFLYFFNSKFF